MQIRSRIVTLPDSEVLATRLLDAQVGVNDQVRRFWQGHLFAYPHKQYALIIDACHRLLADCTKITFDYDGMYAVTEYTEQEFISRNHLFAGTAASPYVIPGTLTGYPILMDCLTCSIGSSKHEVMTAMLRELHTQIVRPR